MQLRTNIPFYFDVNKPEYGYIPETNGQSPMKGLGELTNAAPQAPYSGSGAFVFNLSGGK